MFSFRIVVSDSTSLEALDLRTDLDVSGSPQIEASKDAIMAAVAAALVNVPGNFTAACTKIDQTETPIEA